MPSADDIQFLAKLVHRGHLNQEDAKNLLPRLQSGESLDVLLEEVLEWDTEEIERLRRTDAGEIPEIPGYQVLGNLGTGGTADVWRAREKKTGWTSWVKEHCDTMTDAAFLFSVTFVPSFTENTDEANSLTTPFKL